VEEIQAAMVFDNAFRAIRVTKTVTPIVGR
jgi:hypothetical protein